VAYSEPTAYVRANLPAPPARVLEVGAGEGDLARTLRELGYDVVAIDPSPRGDDVSAVALHELAEPPASFDAAVAVLSLHHVEPLRPSLQRLAAVLKPDAALVVDEFDVAAFDRRAAEWWLAQRRALGGEEGMDAGQLVDEHRSHLHPLELIVEELEPHFTQSTPLRGPYLYRWNLDESLRAAEDDLIARGQLTPVGARFVVRRRRGVRG
jgi:SAM-dependent methyltransferase